MRMADHSVRIVESALEQGKVSLGGRRGREGKRKDIFPSPPWKLFAAAPPPSSATFYRKCGKILISDMTQSMGELLGVD